MFHVTAVQGFGVPAGAAASKPASLFDLAAELVARAERPRGAGLGALVPDFEALLAASAANRPASFVSADQTVYCKVPDRAKSYRLECKANATALAARAPAQAMQRATDALLAMVMRPINQLAGKALEIRLPEGGTQPAPIPTTLAGSIQSIGGGYDGIIGSGTMQFAAPAMLIAAALSFPPPTVVPAFLSMNAFTFTQAAGAIAGFFEAVTRDFDALLAAYKERGRVPAADVLVPETVVVPPAPKAAADKSNVGLLIGLAAVGLAITVGGSYAAARAWRQEHAADADLSPAYGLGRRRYRAYRAYRGGAAW